MAFNTYCTHKGCKQFQAPYIDPADNKVYCSVCDGELDSITIFAKNQMRMAKQFKKKPPSFVVKCKLCKKSDRPKMQNNDFICSNCGKKLTDISEPFKLVLKEFLNKKEE